MSSRKRRWLAAALLAAAVSASCGGSSDDAGPLEDETQIAAPGPDSADCPVEEPVDYSFLEAREGGCHPVRFNPCEPIRYVLGVDRATGWGT